jgi:hypothetical protein
MKNHGGIYTWCKGVVNIGFMEELRYLKIEKK